MYENIGKRYFFFSDSATIEKTVSEKQETDLQD